MKQIATPRGFRIEAFDQPTESITPGLADRIMEPVDKNRTTIIIAAQDIENLLESIVANYFFPPKQKNLRRSEFEGQILKSEWCSFSSKIRLVLYIIEELELKKGKEKSEFEQLLRKVMEYRNAFTHGDISTDGRKVKIKYFKGKPKEKFLEDSWLEEIEDRIKKCYRECMELLKSTSPTLPTMS